MRKDLKAYVRFDGTGRVVPGGPIGGRKKPSVGNWVEGPIDICCSSESSVYVCGAGMTDVNGRYTFAGMKHGRPYFRRGNLILSWGDYPPPYPGYQDWEIYDSSIPNTWYYYSTDNVFIPTATTTWHTDDGINPAPTVVATEADCVGPTCDAVFPILLSMDVRTAEGACSSYGGDMSFSYIDTNDFATATVVYNFADCVSPGNGYYSDGTIVRLAVDGVLGPAVPCPTTTTTTTVPG